MKKQLISLRKEGLHSIDHVLERLGVDKNNEALIEAVECAWNYVCEQNSIEKLNDEEEYRHFRQRLHLNVDNLGNYWKDHIKQLKWTPYTNDNYTDILADRSEGIVRLLINRPERHNAFTPATISELISVLDQVEKDPTTRVVILGGVGGKAFCSGGDQKVRGDSGYKNEQGQEELNVLKLQRMMRALPKPIIAMVDGYAIGGGHVLHMVCDLTIASDRSTFGQTGPKVGSFDGGLGASYMARLVGHKKAREIWFLCCQYTAKQAEEIGLVNRVVVPENIESETYAWCLQIQSLSPTALRCLKSAINSDSDGIMGLQQLAGDATYLFYQTREAQEGRDAFLEKRRPNF